MCDGLKVEVTEYLTLTLTDFSKNNEVHTNAYNFAIAVVLMQYRHQISFERHKLNKVEQRCTMKEKDMTAIVHYLCTWRHNLIVSKLVDNTNNVATSCFHLQKKITLNLLRWQDFLVEYDYV